METNKSRRTCYKSNLGNFNLSLVRIKFSLL
jgi:hypothetical protein